MTAEDRVASQRDRCDEAFDATPHRPNVVYRWEPWHFNGNASRIDLSTQNRLSSKRDRYDEAFDVTSTGPKAASRSDA